MHTLHSHGDDPREVHLLDTIIEESKEDHMSYGEEVRESCAFNFDYEEPIIFDLG